MVVKESWHHEHYEWPIELTDEDTVNFFIYRLPT